MDSNELSDKDITELLDPVATVKALKAAIEKTTATLTTVEIDYGLLKSDPLMSDEPGSGVPSGTGTESEEAKVGPSERENNLKNSGLGKARQQLAWRIKEMNRRLDELVSPKVTDIKGTESEEPAE